MAPLILGVFIVDIFLHSAYAASSLLDVNIVVIWSPSESRFFAEDINNTLHERLPTSKDVVILEDSHIHKYFANDYQNLSTAWTIFVDIREYACPEDIFRSQRLLSYVSVNQQPCRNTSARTQEALVTRVDTRIFDRGALVPQLTNSTDGYKGSGTAPTTHSLALLFDYTGEEYFYERPSVVRLPLVFEISVALNRCAATEQLKNLTAKTEIRDVVVVATADCITQLLTEASSLQLLFGRYRWLLHPTDGQFPECHGCRNVNAVVIIQQNIPQGDVPETRAEKIVRFVKKSVSKMEDTLSEEALGLCNNCSDDECSRCQQHFRQAMSQVEKEDNMVFFRDATTPKKDVTFDIYMMFRNGSNLVGEWSESTGLVSSQTDLYPDSKGDIVLRAVVVVEPPFVFRHDTENGTEYTGYSLDVLEKISKLVGFSFVVRECSNNDYGNDDSGEWNGCIGNVIRGEADVIVGALTVTAEREVVIDFTLPYYDFAGIQILMKKPQSDVNLFYFVDVFTTEAWLCLFGVIVFTSLLLYIFERFSPKRKGPEEGGVAGEGGMEEQRAFNLKESIWFVIGSVTLAGGGEPPRCLASRLLVAGFWFFSVVIMSTFTANLAAFLTVSRMGTTIASLDELAAQKEVKYSVVRESNVRAYFEHQAAIERNFYELWKNMSLGGMASQGDQSLAVWDYPLGDKFGNMWDAMTKTGLLNSTQEGLQKVLDGNFALIYDSPVIKYLVTQDCALNAVGDQFSVRPYAFALKDKSVYTSKFTNAILQLQKLRELDPLKRRWWDDSKVTCSTESRDQGLDLSSLTGTFIVMGGGLCLGLVLLALEFSVSQKNKKQLEKEQEREKEVEGHKPVSTLELNNKTWVTYDQFLAARELKKELELSKST